MSNTSSHAVTARIAQRLAGEVGPHRYNMWFDRTAQLEYHQEGHRLDVAVPNRLVAEWIDKHFRDQLCRAACDEVGQAVALSLSIVPGKFGQITEADTLGLDGRGPTRPFVAETRMPPVGGSAGTAGKLGTGSAAAAGLPGAGRDTAPAFRYSLDDFVVGPSNEMAYNAAHQLVEDRCGSVNPLFIHGGVGLGKTHLLQGICRLYKERNPEARILYTTGEKFTNEYLASMGARTLDKFRQRIRRLDLLAIDDVHFLAGKDKTQQEFLHSFDEIDLGGARVVMASDNPPKQIKQFSAALISRCVRGLVAEVRSPDTSTRVRIVKALAERRGLTLMESVLAVLASRCQGSVREIEGTLAKLHALANLNDGRFHISDASGLDRALPGSGTIGHAMVNKLLDSQPNPTPRRVSFERILEVVCEQLQVTKAQVLSTQRVKPIVLARSLVIYLTRKLTTMSYPEIGAAVNKNSHSTIIAADQRIGRDLTNDHAVAAAPTESGVELVPLSQLVERLMKIILRG